MDIFSAAGSSDKPDISVLSDEFLAEVQGMPHRNLAVELLQKLLKGEVSNRRRKNVVLGPLLRRDAGANPAPLSEPVDRGGSGHRGTNRARQGHARGQRARGAFGPIGRRACLLRRIWRPTTAPCRSWATRRCGTSPANLSTPYATTSPSTGRSEKTSALTFESSCAVFSVGTATRLTNRKRQPRRCWSRLKSYRKAGRSPESNGRHRLAARVCIPRKSGSAD